MPGETIFGLYNYWIVICLMMTGFYIVISRKNLIKTVIGLNIFQTSVVLLYITMGKVTGGTAPIIPPAIVAQNDHAHGDHHGELHAPSRAVDLAKDPEAVTHQAKGGHGTEHHSGDHDDHHNEAGDHAKGSLARSTTDSQDEAAHSPEIIYSNPLPSVLMLTAIVVGIATTALALALIVRIREDYGSIEEDEILQMDRQA